MPIGTDSERHSLRGWHYVHDAQYARDFGTRQTNSSYIQEGQSAVTVMSGSREEILERWKVGAKTGVDLLNRSDLDYPNFGVSRQAGFNGAYNFVVNDSTVNSNSAYRTFGTLMVGGSNVPVFNGPLQPGVNNNVLPSSTIHLLQYDRPQFRQGNLPAGQESILMAQEAQALGNSDNIPVGAIPQDRMDRVATNMAIDSQFPDLANEKQAQRVQPLAQIGSVLLNEDKTKLFLSDAADLRNHPSPNLIGVSMDKLLESPQPQLVQRFQQSEQASQIALQAQASLRPEDPHKSPMAQG